MGDGGRSPYDYVRDVNTAQIDLATHSFTLNEVKRLILMLAKLGIKRAGVSQRITTPELIKIFGLDRLDDVERKWMIEQIHEVKKSIKYKDGPQYTIRIYNSRNSKKFINLVKKEVKNVPAFSDKIRPILVSSRGT